MAGKLILYVCHMDDGGRKPHACRRAHEALRAAGHDYERVIFARGHYFGLRTKGRRPLLKELSGQEQLPVLALPGGGTIAGSRRIAQWAKLNAPAQAASNGARSPMALIEFPADEPERALRFWNELLDVSLEPRGEGEGAGWQSRSTVPPVGVHQRGRGPGDTYSLPYFNVDDLSTALGRVEALGGTIVHPGDEFAICKDSEGSPFGLAAGG